MHFLFKIIFFILILGAINIFNDIPVVTATLNGKVTTAIGVTFSPFVHPDHGRTSKFYTRSMVRVMLEIIRDLGFSKINTWEVGVLNGKGNLTTLGDCTSLVYTSYAAADINKNRNNLELSIYLGIYGGTDHFIADAETHLGFQVAEEANKIYPGTVPAIVFTSVEDVTKILFNYTLIDRLRNISVKTRERNLRFGIKVHQCQDIPSKRGNARLKEIFELVDFIICYPSANVAENSNADHGREKFQERISKEADELGEYFKEEKLSVEVIVEGNWPANSTLPRPNTVSDLKQFWDWASKWHTDTGKLFFLHEAFDQPWKNAYPSRHYSGYNGRWRYDESKGDLLQKEAYVLKDQEDLEEKLMNGSIWVYTGPILVLLVFVLVAVFIVQYKRVNKLKKILTEKEIKEFMYGIQPGTLLADGMEAEASALTIPYDRSFEVEKEKLKILHDLLLGSGQFGCVYKGLLDDNGNKPVAVKMTKIDCPKHALKGLLSEIKILTYLGKHANIVSIEAAYTTELKRGIVYLATELCDLGSLEGMLRGSQFVKSNQNTAYINTKAINLPGITYKEMVRWSYEISAGMEYIGTKNILHADLATRNVLLTSGKVAKITDFGLSRRLYEYEEYMKKQQEPISWKWMAIESLLKLEFSSKSDVWSFGITLWEIFSMGNLPYPGLSWDVNFVNELKNGLRMGAPEHCTPEIYEVMKKCWHLDPNQRPIFTQLKKFLDKVNKSNDYANIVN